MLYKFNKLLNCNQIYVEMYNTKINKYNIIKNIHANYNEINN